MVIVGVEVVVEVRVVVIMGILPERCWLVVYWSSSVMSHPLIGCAMLALHYCSHDTRRAVVVKLLQPLLILLLLLLVVIVDTGGSGQQRQSSAPIPVQCRIRVESELDALMQYKAALLLQSKLVDQVRVVL